MTAATALAALPRDTRVSIIVGQGDLTVDELVRAFVDTSPVMLTTEQAAERFGFQPTYWRKIAPTIAGSVKGRAWLLPVEGCEAHMEARAHDTADEFPETAPTPSARPQGLQAR